MRVAVGDVRLFFEVSGPQWILGDEPLRRRPVMIGLHGGPGRDGTKLRHQLAALADTVQVIVPDQRGHGRSDRSVPERWNLATWAADVKGLTDALELEHPIVLGTSFGGFVAQQYASTYPNDPCALILVSTCARLPSIDVLVERFRELGGDEAASVIQRDSEQLSEETSAEWLRVIAPLLSLAVDPDPIVVAAEAARIETMEVNLHWEKHEGRTMDLRPGLPNVRCPTLVLVGERDPLIPTHLAEEIVSAVPAGLGRLEVIPDASHDVALDNPEHVHRCIRQFVANLS